MNKYIFSKLKRLLEIKRRKNAKADELRIKHIKRYGLLKLQKAVQIQQLEEEMEIKKMSKTAYTFLEFNLQYKALQSFQISTKQEKIKAYKLQRKVYERHLLKNTFRLMFRLKDYI